jgi:hypothetical protein
LVFNRQHRLEENGGAGACYLMRPAERYEEKQALLRQGMRWLEEHQPRLALVLELRLAGMTLSEVGERLGVRK